MSFDPSFQKWQSPTLPVQHSNLNPNHQPPPYYNFPFPSPRSEATVTVPAAAAVAQQNYYYPQGADLSGFSNTTVANQYPIPDAAAQQQYYYHQQGAGAVGNSYYRGESVPEISSIASIPLAPPHIIPQERNNTYRYKGKPKRRLKKAKLVQPLHCAVCKINCDTQEVLNCHKQGKQHKKNLQKLKDAITPKPKEVQLTLNDPEKKEPEKNDPEKKEPEKNDPEKKEPEKNEPEKILESGKSKAQPVHCGVCDVYCNTEEFLKLHEAGKKHLKNVAKLKAPIDTNGEGDKEKKSKGIVEPAYCQICNVLCTSHEDLNAHYQGKNHKKKLKLQGDDIPKPEGSQMVVTNNENSNQLKRTAVEENLTKKKRKVHGCDGGPIQSKMRCELCNIEVNSQIVYDSHIAGSKHAAMVKKLHQFTVVYGHQQEVTAVKDEEYTQY